MLAVVTLFAGLGAHADAVVTTLLTKDLIVRPDQEISMLTVEYAPGESSPKHRHHGQVMVYVLEGTVRMQIEGQELVTLSRGQTFYEGPEDVHLVSANASKTEPAKFLVFKVQGKPKK
jgi:quercetin dioxygenase-like cupin family protein